MAYTHKNNESRFDFYDDEPLLPLQPPIERQQSCVFFIEKLGSLVKASGDCASWEIMSEYLTSQGFSPLSPAYIIGTGTIPACSELVRGLIVYYFQKKYQDKIIELSLASYIKDSILKTMEYFLSSLVVNAAWSPLYSVAEILGFTGSGTVAWVGGLSALICFCVIILARNLFKFLGSSKYRAERFSKDKFIELFKYAFLDVSFISGAFVLAMPGYPMARWIPQVSFLNSTGTSALLGASGKMTSWSLNCLLEHAWTYCGSPLASTLWKRVNWAPLTEIIIGKC
jgi:hypothetical protein